jgi:predicted hydrocarbon binding protein
VQPTNDNFYFLNSQNSSSSSSKRTHPIQRTTQSKQTNPKATMTPSTANESAAAPEETTTGCRVCTTATVKVVSFDSASVLADCGNYLAHKAREQKTLDDNSELLEFLARTTKNWHKTMACSFKKSMTCASISIP